MKKKVYIAGPMTGVPEFNYPAFKRVAKFLREEGWEVVSPVEIGEPYGSPAELANDEALLNRVMVKEQVELMHCDTIYLLPGWEKSEGSKAELGIALERGLEVIQHCHYIGFAKRYTARRD